MKGTFALASLLLTAAPAISAARVDVDDDFLSEHGQMGCRGCASHSTLFILLALARALTGLTRTHCLLS